MLQVPIMRNSFRCFKWFSKLAYDVVKDTFHRWRRREKDFS
jgi:hypothetical protein